MNSKTKSYADLLKPKANQDLQAIKTWASKIKSTKTNLDKENKNKSNHLFMYKRTKIKTIKKNKASELNYLLLSSPPTPINLAICELRGLSSLQSEKGLSIVAKI